MNNKIKNIYLFLIALFVTSSIVIGVYLWLAPRNIDVLKPFFPKTFFSETKAPLDSLQGKTSSISGKVGFVSRTANLATLINSPVNITQGEEIDTYGNGTAIVNFSQVGIVDISSNSQINFIQTLPQNFVVMQKQGIASYTKSGNIPFSIVALDLLTNLGNGGCKVSVDKKTSVVTISIDAGFVTIAFTDLNNNTNILTLQKGDIYRFNDNTKTGIIE